MSADCSTELDIEITEPPSKRRKLDSIVSLDISIISSICFTDNSDQQQFQKLFKIINGLKLIKSLNVPHLITKEIAEFSTGEFAICGNKACPNDIPLLHKDKAIYNKNDREHIYANRLGYKYCNYSLKYYCINCMNYAQPCTACDCDSDECKQLKYIRQCDECSNCYCDNIITPCSCGDCDECCLNWPCTNCSYKGCYECYGTEECISCNEEFCNKCRIKDGIYNDHRYDEYTICNGCYNDSIIECDKCNTKCKLFFENNRWLGKWNFDIGRSEMVKCHQKECKNFICMNCNENEQNGKCITCSKLECDERLGFFCKMHIPTGLLCYNHRNVELKY